MIEAWIPITIAAAFFQNLRSALQKHLKGRLSNSGAAYARFFYALPIALLLVIALNRFGALEWPQIHLRFLFYCTLGGISQILFTVFLLWMFSFRSFAVGTTISKLEVVMVAILGFVILDDTLNPWAILAIVLSSLGLLALGAGQEKLNLRSLLAGLSHRSTLIGLVCAGWLGASVVFFRAASLSLQHDSVVMAAAFSLTVSLLIQTILMGLWLTLREPGQLSRVVAEWRWAGAVGVSGVLASLGWFTAFTLQNASYVRALGQVELVFTFIATTVFFRERVSSLETLGILLVGGGIILILLA